MTKEIKPLHWFRTIYEIDELTSEPFAIEYLKMVTGETYIHTYGTVFWRGKKEGWNIEGLKDNGITHWRVRLDIAERVIRNVE